MLKKMHEKFNCTLGVGPYQGFSRGWVTDKGMKNIYLQFGLGHTMNVVKKSKWGLKINFKRQIMMWF